MINTEKLTKELQKAEIKISGCNDAGVVWAEDGKTEIQNRKDVKAAIAAHDPTPEKIITIEDRLAVIEEDIKKLKEKKNG